MRRIVTWTSPLVLFLATLLLSFVNASFLVQRRAKADGCPKYSSLERSTVFGFRDKDGDAKETIAKSTDNEDESCCECSSSRRKLLLSSTAATIALAASEGSIPAASASEATKTKNNPDSSPYPRYFDPVVPFSTRRQMKTVILPQNGLKVLLVSDKQAIRATAALSIQNAGQFADPPEISGLAHLMEHMVLSSSTKPSSFFQREGGDFEEWLENRDGYSNAFTAYNSVCFHFSGPADVFPDALERFATLFVQEVVESVCRNEATIKREILRVDAELDYSSDVTQAFYLTKQMVNPAHPFARFGAGSLETLEKIPKENDLNVGQFLIDFFDKHYLPSEAVLAVVCPADISTLERWVLPFSLALSRTALPPNQKKALTMAPSLSGPFPIRSKLTQLVIFRSKDDSPLTRDNEKLSLEWPLRINYDEKLRAGSAVLCAPAVGFILSQILARRGPGSLYLFLLRRGWVGKGNQSLPRISFPVDVSGFQLMKLDIFLTRAGFANRSAVIAAVYDSIRKTSRICQPPRSFLLPRELLNQYATVARLHGYLLAPRPPDAVELVTDAQTYGLSESTGVGSLASWPIFPSTDDVDAMNDLRKAVADTLELMDDPTKAIITITASSKAIASSGRTISDDAVPQLSSPRWQVDPLTGGKYFVESTTKFPGYAEAWIAERLDEDELLPPAYNPLIPARIRPARPITERAFSDGSRRIFFREAPGDTIWREFTTQTPDRMTSESSWEDRVLVSIIGPEWKLRLSPSSTSVFPMLPIPMMPLEPTCRSGFVIQLLSSRPARANAKQAAFSQLWLTSFHEAVSDLVSLFFSPVLCFDFSYFGAHLFIMAKGGTWCPRGTRIRCEL